jgi:hypothetical protein
MEEATLVLPHDQWTSFNRARKFYQVYFMSQLLLCDGMTVDPLKLSRDKHARTDTHMKFPKEHPTAADLTLWRDTIYLLKSPTFRFSPRLGKHLRLPYEKVYWVSNESRDCITRMSAADKPKVYQLKTMQYLTRGRQIFHESFSSCQPETTHVVSVRDYTPSGITVHSQSPLKLERPAR